MSTAEQIMREIQKLPEPLAREVLDFNPPTHHLQVGQPG